MSDPIESLTIDLPDCAATEALATRIGRLLRPRDAILLEGSFGAGKTYFARSLLRGLTGDPGLEVPSPSYTLVQQYQTPAGEISHFDLWRLGDASALTELGWDDARDGIVLVEWPSRLGPWAPKDSLVIELVATGAESRRATITGWPGRLASLAA
jgi:tRNA threonylcarbamoyladenosine biosynthesis protein TsaE